MLVILILFILLPKILCLRVRNIIQPCERQKSQRSKVYICSLKSAYTSLSMRPQFQGDLEVRSYWTLLMIPQDI